MGLAGLGRTGRLATRLAAAFAPPYMARFYLARLTDNPYVDPDAVIHHDELVLGPQSFIADRVIVTDDPPTELLLKKLGPDYFKFSAMQMQQASLSSALGQVVTSVALHCC